jgi:hypothetical protein
LIGRVERCEWSFSWCDFEGWRLAESEGDDAEVFRHGDKVSLAAFERIIARMNADCAAKVRGSVKQFFERDAVAGNAYVDLARLGEGADECFGFVLFECAHGRYLFLTTGILAGAATSARYICIVCNERC